jgi:serine/threonine protein phosphatase 1
MTNYVIADIHGNYDGFKEILKLVDYDMKSGMDSLIILGDIVDGGRKARQCINLALSIPNMTFCQGNHDEWSLQWMKGGPELPVWVHQGGYATMESYGYDRKKVPASHIHMLENAPYYLIKDDMIFVHGGFNPLVPIQNNKKEFLVWDRTLIKYAKENTIKGYSKVFIGHTSTQLYGLKTDPLFFHNLIMCDTGGGWNGKLSIIDIDTLKYWQVGGVHQQGFERDGNLKKTYFYDGEWSK